MLFVDEVCLDDHPHAAYCLFKHCMDKIIILIHFATKSSSSWILPDRIPYITLCKALSIIHSACMCVYSRLGIKCPMAADKSAKQRKQSGHKFWGSTINSN